MSSWAEPPPRYSHFSALVEDNVCVYGGNGKVEDPDLLHIFNVGREQWLTAKTTGEHPPSRARVYSSFWESTLGKLYKTFAGVKVIVVKKRMKHF